MKVSVYCACFLWVTMITYLLNYFFLKFLCKLVSLKTRIEILEPKVYSKLIKEFFRNKRGLFLDMKTVHQAPTPIWPKHRNNNNKNLTLRWILRKLTSAAIKDRPWWAHPPTNTMKTEAQAKSIISELWKLTKATDWIANHLSKRNNWTLVKRWGLWCFNRGYCHPSCIPGPLTCPTEIEECPLGWNKRTPDNLLNPPREIRDTSKNNYPGKL